MRFHKAFQNKKSNSLLELNQSRWSNYENRRVKDEISFTRR